jgi:tRNA-dihydrouridine synthase
MKRHFASYLRGYPDVAELRKRVFATNEIAEVREAFEDYRAQHSGVRVTPPPRETAA